MIDLNLILAEIVDGGSGGIASGWEGTVGEGVDAFKRRRLPSEGVQESLCSTVFFLGISYESFEKTKLLLALAEILLFVINISLVMSVLRYLLRIL
jgi:hypothetical protein